MRQQVKAKKPFYVALWNYTVHWPMEAPEEFVAKWADKPKVGYNHKVYPAMLETMDLAIARVLEELNTLEIEEETFVVFTSDNGPFGGVVMPVPCARTRAIFTRVASGCRSSCAGRAGWRQAR